MPDSDPVEYTHPDPDTIWAVSGDRGYYYGRPGTAHVGMVAFYHPQDLKPSEWSISDIDVYEDFWRRGIGRELVRRAEAEMKKRGAKVVYVTPGDDDGAAFWEAVGYRPFDSKNPALRDFSVRKRLR